jgi:hypothetical protein
MRWLKLLKQIVIIFLLGLLTVWITAGCNEKAQAPKDNIIVEQTHTVSPGPVSTKLTTDEIKSRYGPDQKILSMHEIGDGHVLVESQRPTFANVFELFNLATGNRDVMPTPTEFVTLECIENENHIVFLSSGKNSECIFGNFPYLIRCVRVKTKADSKDDFNFMPIFQDKYFNLGEEISSGSKSGCSQLSDVIITLDGIQALFKPLPGREDLFYAAATDIPETKIFTDKSRMVIQIADTQIGGKLKDKMVLPAGENQYLTSLKVTKDGRDIELTVTLKEVAREYTAKIERLPNGLPYFEVAFKG